MQVNISPFEHADEKRSHPGRTFVVTGVATLQKHLGWRYYFKSMTFDDAEKSRDSMRMK